MIRTLIFLLAVLVTFNHCGQQKSESTQQNHASKTNLKIEYKPTRGQSYTDSLGTKYQLRHIPAKITNDSTVPVQVQITFLKEYDYPDTYADEQFSVFPMPEVWALDGVEISDSTLKELPKYIGQASMSKVLKPGEHFLFAIGTLYPNEVGYGAFPVALFSHDDRALHHECNQLINPDELTIPDLELELLIGFTSGSQASPDSCTTITCGQVSYPKTLY